MPTKTINIQETEININDLLSIVLEGTEIIFTEGTILLARLTPVRDSLSRQAGLHRGAIWISEDFDDPLPELFWAEYL
jgi:antitoxin (DNA-binding transcriptional repressor) of toxin-antitoxin stability system